MKSSILDTLAEMEMRVESEALRNVPDAERIQALDPDAAKLLFVTAMGLKPKSIVEVGTNRGYSTIWLAAVAEKTGGKVVTCEIEPAKAEEARSYFEKAGVSDRIEILVGDARETLRNQEGTVDLLFIDAQKGQYETYFDVVYKRLSPGSVVIADNAVSHGDELLDYITYVQNHPSFESVTVPIGSGLEISVRTE